MKFWNPIVLSVALIAGTIFPIHAQNTDADEVVASRGTANITFTDIDALVGQLDKSVRGGYMDDPQRIELTLNGMLLARQIANEARNVGLEDSSTFKARLALAADGILMQMEIERHLDDLVQPDFTILAKERYAADDKAVYIKPERRDVSHILISTKNRSDDAAKKLIGELLERLQQGDAFDELAKIYSDDRPAKPNPNPLAASFWRLKDVIKGKTDKAFEDAAWALVQPGDVSGIVKSTFGYHIIRLDAVHPMEKPAFENVEKIIVDQLRDNWIKDQKAKFLDSFKAKELIADPQRVESLRTRYFPKSTDTKKPIPANEQH